MSIEIHHLTKTYRSHIALDDITVTFENGMYGLLGKNGAGKSTFLKILATLTKPTSGDITINGVSRRDTVFRKMIGYVPQNFSFYPNMTIYDSMKYLAALSEISVSRQNLKIPLLLQQVNLWEMKKKKIRTLSGGMIKRLGIAQALINNPKILIADEPTAGLDPEERIRLYHVLEEYSKDNIVILSTHIASDIEAVCKRVCVLDSGRLVFNGSVDSLKEWRERQ